jgi:hypothetical protein
MAVMTVEEVAAAVVDRNLVVVEVVKVVLKEMLKMVAAKMVLPEEMLQQEVVLQEVVLVHSKNKLCNVI